MFRWTLWWITGVAERTGRRFGICGWKLDYTARNYAAARNQQRKNDRRVSRVCSPPTNRRIFFVESAESLAIPRTAGLNSFDNWTQAKVKRKQREREIERNALVESSLGTLLRHWQNRPRDTKARGSLHLARSFPLTSQACVYTSRTRCVLWTFAIWKERDETTELTILNDVYLIP